MKYLPLLALVLMLILTNGCGKQLVPNKVEVEHTVNLAGVEPYIRAYCETQYADPQQIQDCINLEIGKLLHGI